MNVHNGIHEYLNTESVSECRFGRAMSTQLPNSHAQEIERNTYAKPKPDIYGNDFALYATLSRTKCIFL